MKKVDYSLMSLVLCMLLLLGGCSPYMGKTMPKRNYNDFFRFDHGHHLVKIDVVTVDYDWTANTETNKVTFVGNYQLEGILLSPPSDICKNISVNFELLFMDENYKVLNVGYIYFFVDYGGYDDRRSGRFIKSFEFNPQARYVHWVCTVRKEGRC